MSTSIVLILTVPLLVLGAAYSKDQSDDPFIEPRASEATILAGAEPITLLKAQEALGLPEWSLHEWPRPIQKEIRVYFRPARSRTTELLRLAIAEDACWIEKRETSQTRNASWGSVVRRVSVKIPLDDEVLEIAKLSDQEALYRAPSPHELALIDSFTADSVWIIDSLSEQYRQSIIIRNAEMVSTLAIPNGRELIRDFSQYEKIWGKLNEVLSKHVESKADADD